MTTIVSVPEETTAPAPAKRASRRIAAIDWMRGIAMMIMMLAHVSMAYNSGHVASDSASLYTPGAALWDKMFLTRWLGHLCAPTFFFLAGTALALSVERRAARGVAAATIDRQIISRGIFIAALDPTVISLCTGRLLIQVLYAIGLAMICMSFLRRLSTRWLLVLALGWIFLGELVAGLFVEGTDPTPPIWTALLFSTYSSPALSIKYPLLPWLSIMILGWVFGRHLLRHTESETRLGLGTLLSLCGVCALGVFAVVRYFNGYGNAWLYRDDNSWIQWLHVSKYPPSLSYIAMELGLMAICLAALMRLERWFGVRKNGPLLVFGQTAMFYYLVHRIMLETSATWFGLRGFSDLRQAYLISAVALLVLYPVCWWYRGLKARHAGAVWTRYL